MKTMQELAADIKRELEGINRKAHFILEIADEEYCDYFSLALSNICSAIEIIELVEDKIARKN